MDSNAFCFLFSCLICINLFSNQLDSVIELFPYFLSYTILSRVFYFIAFLINVSTLPTSFFLRFCSQLNFAIDKS